MALLRNHTKNNTQQIGDIWFVSAIAVVIFLNFTNLEGIPSHLDDKWFYIHSGILDRCFLPRTSRLINIPASYNYLFIFWFIFSAIFYVCSKQTVKYSFTIFNMYNMVTIFNSWKLTSSNGLKTGSKGYEIVGNVKKRKN